MKRRNAILWVCLSCCSLANSNGSDAAENGAALGRVAWTPLSIRLALDADSLEKNASPPVCGFAMGLGGIEVDGTLNGLGLGLPVIASQGGSGLMVSGLLSYSVGSGQQSNATCWKGIQASLAVSGSDDLSGVQIGLIGAGANRVNGIQIGGLLADSERLEGIALGGLLASSSTGHGLVCSPGFTSTGSALALANAPSLPFRGIQLAGAANFAMEVRGIQIGLGANIARECNGVQVSLLYNRADELNGLQFGLINVAHGGVGLQIGLLNMFGTDGHQSALPFLNARF